MTVGVGASGATAVDVRPVVRKEVVEHARHLGVHASPARLALLSLSRKEKFELWRFCGGVAGLVKEEAECEVFGEEFEPVSLAGCLFYGALTGLITTVRSGLEWKVQKKIADWVFDDFAYEKKPTLSKIRLLKALLDAETLEVSVMPSARPFDPDKTLVLDKLIGWLSRTGKVLWYGAQISYSRRKMHPKVKSCKGRIKAVGPFVLGAGFRVWVMAGTPARFSAKWKRTEPVLENETKDIVEDIIEGLEDFRVFKKTLFAGDWVG